MSINQYCIQDQIGKGSFATVYKAINLKTNQKVAIKIISKTLSKQEIQLAEKQIKILQQINHKNIIKLYDHFYEGQTYYMILEYCGQGDLQKLLKKQKKFSQQLVSLIAIQIISGLIQLQKQNIAHRDIKLANIFVNDKFQIKLADLGFAKATSQQQLLKSYAGTPLIMAPQILQHKKYTNKCDVWSFGIVLFYMLYGKFPFLPTNNGGLQQLTQIVIKKPVQFLKNIETSFQAQDFIKKCLEKQPENRLRPQDMLKHPWIQKGKLIKTKINDLIQENYRLSQIFLVQDENSFFLNNQRLRNQFDENIKKNVTRYIKKYGQILEHIKQSIKQIQKSENYKNLNKIIYKLIQLKLNQIQYSKLIIEFKKSNKSYKCIQLNSFEYYKNGKPIVDKLKKSINGKQSFKQNIQKFQRQALLQLLYLFKQLISSQLNKKQKKIIIKIILAGIKLLRAQLKIIKIDIIIKDNLYQKIQNYAIKRIQQITKQQILKIITQPSQKNFIFLTNILDVKLQQNSKVIERQIVSQQLINDFLSQMKLGQQPQQAE